MDAPEKNKTLRKRHPIDALLDGVVRLRSSSISAILARDDFRKNFPIPLVANSLFLYTLVLYAP